MKRAVNATLIAVAVACVPTAAIAHISLVSGPGFANTTQEITFGVGHGCAGADTYRVRIEIPASVTSVRPETSGFGKTSVEKDAAGNITAVTWQKADADALATDQEYYKLTMRLKVPNQPFTNVYFAAHQTCRAADATLTVVDWIGLPTATPTDAGAEEPAPVLSILPVRRAGWNKFTVATAVSDLATTFGDALIVWKGTAAYSANPTTADLIKTTAGVTALSALTANDEVWVKY
jgi:uncharacterized protein YcnI